MNILDLTINWSPKFDNVPSIQVLIDEIPSNLVYTDRHPFYFAEKDGFVSFFYYQKPGDGYGRRAFDIETDKGPKVLKGPWSSNSDAMRSAGFPDTINVSYTDSIEAFKRGFTFLAGHMLFEVIEEAMKTYARGCVFATVGGMQTIVKRNLLLYMVDTKYPDMPRMGSPDLSEGQARLVGWGVPSQEWVAAVSNRCGAYAESWEWLGKAAEDWLGCSKESGHEGNHKDTTECGHSVMVSPTLCASPQWKACTKPLGHEGLHIDFRSH